MMNNGFHEPEYSVWDLGASLDPNLETSAELDRTENFLIAESLRTARRRIKELEGSHHADLHEYVAEREMEAHENRVHSIMRVVHDVRTGLPV